MSLITKRDVLEAIAVFISWVVIAKLLKDYLKLPEYIEGGLVWTIAWLAQKVIQGILEKQIAKEDIEDQEFLQGKGLETLREMHCRSNPQDEVCSRRSYHLKN